MKVLVAGLSRQSSAVVEMMIGSVFRGATVIQQPRSPQGTTAAPAAPAGAFDLCVVDLMGIGWDRCTPEREAALHEGMLGDRPAIVLLPAGGGGWGESPALENRSPQRIALAQPASMNALLDAMMRLPQGNIELRPRDDRPARARCEAMAVPAGGEPAKAGESTPSPPGPALAAEGTQAGARPATAGTPKATIAFRLRRADRRALFGACPRLRDQAFLNVVLDLLERGKSCELRIGHRAVAVFCPQRNWVASNLSVALRRRIAQHRPMLDLIEVRPLTPAEAASAAQPLFGRRRDGRRALDTFVFSFVCGLLSDDPPEVDGNFEFNLGRLPDFTRLPLADDLFMQMALYAMRRPMTVAGLRAAFARDEPRRADLFVVCAVLSNMASAPATVAAAVAASGAAAAGAPMPRAPAAQRGFIRSLLARLF